MAIRFRKSRANPVIPRTEGTFYSVHSANPDVVRFGNEYLIVFRGQDERRHDEIGVGRYPVDRFDGDLWTLPARPSITVSPDEKAFDSGYVLDPASIVVGNTLRVYYTAHRSDWSSWNIPSFIGLAESEDGVRFAKHPAAPLIEGMAPEVIIRSGVFFLFFQRIVNGRISIFCCRSDDGIRFDEANVARVLEPSGGSEWDRSSLSTARICEESGTYFMFFGGCANWPDYPEAIGLARSRDLVTWERYPANPILARGTPGDWDEGAVWFATVEQINGAYHLWYEGVGVDASLQGPDRERASRLCRGDDYGGYASVAFSQIGHATFSGSLIDNWDS